MKKILYRLGLLMLLMSLYSAAWGYILILALFIIEHATLAFMISLIIPILLGYLIVNEIKWWLISIPIQFLICTIVISICNYGALRITIELFQYVVMLLLAEAIGGGLKLIIRKIKQIKILNASQENNVSE